jgi:hypothetical protein
MASETVAPQMLQDEFDKFAPMAYHHGVTLQQYTDLRRAFFAGAASFLALAMAELSPGDDATEHDVRLVRALQAELREFNEAVKRGDK